MKVTLLILFMSIFGLHAENVLSQNVFVTISQNNVPLEKVLNTIEKQTNYLFVINANVNTSIKVSVNARNEKIQDVLSKALKGTKINYTVDGDYIVLSDRQKEDNSNQVSDTQQKDKIKGNVVDENGDPIIGVNVVIKGTSKGTITDLKGEFQLEANSKDLLLLTYIGYQSQEVTVGTKRDIRVQMREDNKALEEVVVIGYGIQKKSDITGAVSSVESQDLTKMATASPAQALQGRAAGVSVVQESGSPDASTSIHIRGVGTTNDSNPLYVVDGFPMSDINYLNPNDISSMEILKDASACAIYGSRGANGVILITTKKSKAGELKVSFNGYYGIESLSATPHMLNSKQYATLSNEAFKNAGEAEPYSNISSMPYNTDWFDIVSHTGQVQSYNVNFSGGSDNMSSNLSVNYYNKKGIIKSTDYDRLTFMQNSTLNMSNLLKLETSLSGSFSKHHTLDPTSVFLSSLIAPPDIPVIDPDTEYYTGITKIRLGNPAGRIARNNSDYGNTYLIGNITATLNLTKDLTFVSRLGIRHQSTYNSDFEPVYYETANISSTINTVSRDASKSNDWTWENIITYHKLFNEAHDLTIMAASSARQYNEDDFKASKQNVPIEDKDFWYLDSATENPETSGGGASLSMLSYLGRVNYNYKNRYLLTASMRTDGSSRFTKSNRWGVFPSGALAWKISEEKFFKNWNQHVISNVKLRAGYGEIGNENISSYYPYLTPIGQKQYYTLGSSQSRVNGSGPTALGNPDVKWESSKQTNFGLDLLFLDGKISATVDYYIKKTDNILLSQQVPTIAGASSIVRNVGGMQNKGLEFTLIYKERGSNSSYDISANISTVNNKVTSLGNSDALISSFDYDYVLIDFQGALGSMIRSEVGKPYGQFYGWQTDGIFQNQNEIDKYTHNGELIQPNAKPGDFKFKDNNDDGTIDDSDKAFIGNPIPDITFGLSFNGTYKKFDISLLLQGQAGNDIYNAAKYYFMRFSGEQNVRTDYLSKYWKGENTSNSQPIVTTDATRNDRNYKNSDFYVEDGSYLRLKTLQLGYTFNPSILKSGKSTCRVYVSAQNLFTITGYSGFEPEISGICVDRGMYPQARTFMVGTSINF